MAIRIFTSLITTAALMLPVILTAQPGTATDLSRTGFAYAHLGVGVGLPHAFRVGADFILKGRHELTIGYTGMARKSPGVPSGAPKLSGLFDLTDYPQESFSGLTLGYGYVFYLPSSSLARKRIVLRASALLGNRNDLSNVQVDRSPEGVFYTYERSDYNSRGLLLEPHLQLIAGRGFGMETGPYVVMTDHMFGAGVSVSMLFGYVSNYRRPVTALGKQRHDYRQKHPFRRYPKSLQ